MMPSNCGIGEDTWQSLRQRGDQTSKSQRKSTLIIHWKDCCWSSFPLATCIKSTHWKSLWCWERLKAGGEGSDRGCDDWMASPTWWTWVWVSSRSRWWTGKPGLLQSMGSQRVRHNWATELNMLMTRVWENWQFSLFVVMNISWHKSYKEQFSHIHQNYRCTLPFYPESFNFRNGSY